MLVASENPAGQVGRPPATKKPSQWSVPRSTFGALATEVVTAEVVNAEVVKAEIDPVPRVPARCRRGAAIAAAARTAWDTGQSRADGGCRDRRRAAARAGDARLRRGIGRQAVFSGPHEMLRP